MANTCTIPQQSREFILGSLAFLIACAAGCNDPGATTPNPSTPSGGANSSTMPTAGGAVGEGTGTGGASTSNGGVPSDAIGQGGTTANESGHGGSGATTTATTNSSNGGAINSGGSSSTATGGAAPIGGANLGGASSGGATSKVNTGGVGQGGRIGMGGAASGGKATTASGGRAQGGSATGGVNATGGAANSGVAGGGSGTLTATAQEFVDAHNAIRSAVTKPANYTGTWAPIPNVTWSDTVAASAQAWVNKLRDEQNCGLVHEGSGTGYGENLASGTNLQPTAAVNLWASEASKYTWSATYTVADFNAGSGHYTQVVWRKSIQIGCASATCGSNRVVISCRYSPPGNVTGGSQSVY